MILNNYMPNNSVNIKMMSKEQEQAVFDAIRCGDEALRESLAQSCMETVRATAEKFASSEVSFEELLYEVAGAMYDAIYSFNYFTDEQFDSYLTRRLEERVKEVYSNLSWLLPIDPRIVQLHDRYKMALLELYPKCKNPEDKAVQDEKYVADYLNVSLNELRAMKNEYAMCQIQSLDELVIDDLGNKVPLIETIVDPKTDNGAADYLDDLMDCLSDSERYVVCAKNGVLSVEERTNEQIAGELGINKIEIEKIYQHAIDKIRKTKQ